MSAALAAARAVDYRRPRGTWRGGRVAEGGGLLNRYTAQKLYRGFESLPLRKFSNSSRRLLAATACVVALASPACSLEARCNRGDGISCGVLGDRTHMADPARACQFYRKGCGADNVAACVSLGALLGQQKCQGPPGEARTVLQRACDGGEAPGCNNLAMLFRDGADGVARDRDQAIALFRRACPRAAIACDNLGALLIDTDEAGATAAFQMGCASETKNQAQAGCCYKLGLSYSNGWGVAVDRDKARSLYQVACTAKVGGGCYGLGLLELDGTGGEPVQAATHFRQGCELGMAPACNNIGLMYAQGRGVDADSRKALEYLERGCDGGELRACANVGSRYFLGEGAPLDAAKGRALLRNACDGGVSEACTLPIPSKH